jgi:hypothetical protein
VIRYIFGEKLLSILSQKSGVVLFNGGLYIHSSVLLSRGPSKQAGQSFPARHYGTHRWGRCIVLAWVV